MITVDSKLDDWADVAARSHWPTLLTGNGSSMAVWSGFGYKRLRDHASLDVRAQEAFDAAETENFELVLEALRHSAMMCAAFGHDPQDASERYDLIRDSLFEAVAAVHVEHHQVAGPVLEDLEAALAAHTSIFTTNYDLLHYWAIMSAASGPRVKDFLWHGGTFDATDTDLWSGSSGIYFLHGGVHLFVDLGTGESGKAVHANLLDLARNVQGNRVPLVVTEARSKDKMRAIRRSDYLAFTYQALVENDDPLVIFGSALGQSDQHIVDAINKHSERRVAVSLRPGPAKDIITKKSAILASLDARARHVFFFDATTHPLGSSSLHVG